MSIIRDDDDFEVVTTLVIAAAAVVLTLLLTSCGGALAGGTLNFDPPHVDRTAEFTSTCSAIWVEELGRAIDPPALASCIVGARAGQTGDDIRAFVRSSAEYAAHQAALAEANRHVDPSDIPLAQLAALRGDIFPRANVCADAPRLPYGPRPGSPDNIIATTYFDNYTTGEQEAVARCLTSVGFTHVAVGGLVDQWAYHGQYIGHDYSTPDGFEKFLDLHQWFWDHGLTPVTFIHQDGATLDETRAMVRRLVAEHPRAQKLIRIVVMSGWEPAKYQWSSCTWAGYVALGREAFPNALNLIHTVSDVDAPVGTDALCNDDDKTWNPGGNGAGWQRVIDAGLHGWLIQNGPYEAAPTNPAWTDIARQFAAQFKKDGDGATYHGVAWHFGGPGGWTGSSAWGQGVPICLYAAEHTAYEAYWANRPSEADRAAWGNLAVASGACGYLDGGTAPVPVRR